MKEFTVTFPEDQFNSVANLLQLICVAGLELHGRGNAIPTKEELHKVWRTLVTASIGSAQGKKTDKDIELEYLQYFYEAVRPCLGPADSEVIAMIKERFEKKAKLKLPPPYNEEE